jgi:hypothetical protein
MPTSREICSIAKNAIGSPRDDVRIPRFNRATAARADVLLLRLHSRDWLNGPFCSPPHLRALPGRKEAVERIVSVWTRRTTLS